MSTTIILIYIIFIIILLLSLNCKSLRLYKWIQLIFHHDDTIEIRNNDDYEKINNIHNNNNIKKQISNCLNVGSNSNNNHCNNVTIINDIWLIPGPTVLPIFGTKWIYFWRYKINKIHEAYKELNRIYGPIVLEVASGGVPVILLYDRNDIDKVLRYPSKYPFRPPTEIVTIYRKNRPDRYASAGIPNEQGERWHHLRTKLTPFITSPKTLAMFLPILNTICDDFIDLIKYKRDTNNIVNNFQDLANLMGLEAVCMLMLGRRMGFLSKDPQPNDNIKQLANAVKQLFISQHDSFYGFGLWKYLPTSTYRQFAKSEDIIYNIISEMVDNTLLDDQLECNDNDVRSVFISILQTSDLDIKDKKSAIIDFIAAGIETLANTLTFIMFHLSKNPTAQEKIYKEFAQTMHSDVNIMHEQLSKAVYTKACLQESFRLSPTAFALARILEEDTILSGFNIKSGSIVLCQTMLACHNDKNFANAKTFLPERWLNSDNNKISNNCNNNNNNTDRDHVVTRPVGGYSTTLVAPFGVGKRMCPGKRFVEMEVILLIAKITKQFFIKFDGELDTQCEFLLAPKVPVNIVLTDRR